MSFRQYAGTILAYSFNHWIGHLPCHFVRCQFLRQWLAGVGEGAVVQLGCRFLNGRKITLGPRNVINYGCILDGRRFSIRIGADVSIGPEATILTLGHEPQSPDFQDRGGEVEIQDRVWIGYRALILPGVRIGEGAVVGAGAVVTKNVDPYTIVAGNPARKIGDRNRDLNYTLKIGTFLS